MSGPASLSVIFLSCNVRPCKFGCPSLSCPAISVNPSFPPFLSLSVCPFLPTVKWPLKSSLGIWSALSFRSRLRVESQPHMHLGILSLWNVPGGYDFVYFSANENVTEANLALTFSRGASAPAGAHDTPVPLIWISGAAATPYTLCLKKVCHLMFVSNFGNSWTFFSWTLLHRDFLQRLSSHLLRSF